MTRWAGTIVKKTREEIAARGWPQPCTKCGRPVYGDSRWQADHYAMSRHEARLAGVDVATLPTGPAHADCNMSAGGKLGARITNSRRRHEKKYQPLKRMPSEAARGIRGV